MDTFNFDLLSADMADHDQDPPGAAGGGSSGGRTDPLRKYEEKLEEIEHSIAEAERKEEERAKVLEDNMKRQMHDIVSDLQQNFERSFQNQMCDMETRYTAHTKERVETKQTDILRVNKMIRDVSRALGQDEWRSVFQILMSSFPKDVVSAEVVKIEQQRPFMQAYKAITTWKEMKGEDFKSYQLAEALRECNHYGLAEQVLDILDGKYIISLLL